MWARGKDDASDFVYNMLSYERIDSMYVSGDYVYLYFGLKAFTDFCGLLFYEVMERSR